MLDKVISGGQTGADRAGLDAALQYGILTGGWMPKGFIAHDGAHPEFKDKYGMQEHSSAKYPPRTALNVIDSDGTIRFASNFDSPGEVLTANVIKRYKKPNMSVNINDANITPAHVADWIIANKISVLNVAGNSEKTSPRIGEFVQTFLIQVFDVLRYYAEGKRNNSN